MPPVDFGEYLLHFLIEIGPTGGDGGVITFTEIRNWSDLTETKLTLFEIQTLRHLSKQYVIQYRRSIDINCQPPWYTTNKTQAERRAAVADGLRALAKRKRK